VNATVTRQAIVGAFMKTASNTKQVTLGTFRLAELNAGPEIYHCVVEGSAQLFHARVIGLETLCVRLEPLFNMSNTEIDEVGQVLHEVRDPFRVLNLLPCPRPIPRSNKD
jgi:hypothetical protein